MDPSRLIFVDETWAKTNMVRLRGVDQVRGERVAGAEDVGLEAFKKNFPDALAKVRQGVAAGKRVEVWFQDEARVGQKNGITRRWAKRGSRPVAPHDQRTASVYLFGAICPREGKGAALVLPHCNTEAMSLHLAEVAAAVAPDAHAVRHP